MTVFPYATRILLADDVCQMDWLSDDEIEKFTIAQHVVLCRISENACPSTCR